MFFYLREDSLDLSWLLLTFVCRLWRLIALNNPLFWSTFRVRPHWRQEVVEAFLCRSGTTALSVVIEERPHAQELELLFTLLAPHANRLKSLSLEFNLKHLPVVKAHLVTISLGISTLRLAATYYASTRQDDLNGTQCLFLMKKMFPALQELYFDGVVVDAQPSLLAQLTKLDMCDVWYFERFSTHPTFHEYLYTTLSACSSLEELRLRNVFDSNEPIAALEVQLPRLRVLALEQEGTTSAKCLPFFSVPLTAAIDVTSAWSDDCWFDWRVHGSGPRTFRTVLPLPHQDTAAAHRFSHTHTLRLHVASERITVCGYLEEINTPWSGSVDLREVEPSGRIALLNPAVLELPRFVDSSRIVTLDIHVANDLRGQVPWVWVLENFPNVRQLVIGGDYTVLHYFATLCSHSTVGYVTEWFARLDSFSICLPEVWPVALVALQHVVCDYRWMLPRRAFVMRVPACPLAGREVTAEIGQWATEMSARGVSVDVIKSQCEGCSVCSGRR
ncbi:hypothetical protein BN946_scf184996.g59 [Trametes cinnabarina]|uniref:F-box domain-containing protein n=1 Tax=Pycnoporus cinnabarinus TaxID=5643 RepID=A0A060S8B9_PYCCI|nr:hypothetical protein BN946_scf184996.g59 [Trametes cinnabarina]